MVKWQLRRKAVANVAAAINDAGNGSTSSGGTEENWLKNAAAALGARSFYQGNRVFAETQKHDLLNVC
jgi:hypothetical protein